MCVCVRQTDEDSWLTERRDERPSEFAPPRFYSESLGSTGNQRQPRIKHAAFVAAEKPVSCASSQTTSGIGEMVGQLDENRIEDEVSLRLGAIRRQMADDAGTASNNDSVSGPDVVHLPAAFASNFSATTDGVYCSEQPYVVSGNAANGAWSDQFGWSYSSASALSDPYSHTSVSVALSMAAAAGDASAVVSYSVDVSRQPAEDEVSNEAERNERPVETCADESSIPPWSSVHQLAAAAAAAVAAAAAPQPAHYSSSPSLPQPKQPKYERVFLHDLPPTLPAPPVAGSSASLQYPSQEEVIGPRRKQERRELDEQAAIKNWYRQFDKNYRATQVAGAGAAAPAGLASASLPSQKNDQEHQTGGVQTVLLKPKSIPFASPYIQLKDGADKDMEERAAAEFDPSRPPPPV